MVLLRSNRREKGRNDCPGRSVLFSEEIAWELEGEQPMTQKQKKRSSTHVPFEPKLRSHNQSGPGFKFGNPSSNHRARDQ